MDRLINYPGQIPLETDLLNTNRNTMIALGKLAGAIFGTSSNIVNGLAVVPTSPASLAVNVNAGELYSLQNVDNAAYSSLPADTTDTVVKQGIQLQPVSLSCPAPATAGFSINYLIEATFAEVDSSPVTLPYYNASNPSQAYSGPNNSGAQQNTKRAGTVSLQAKAGIAATTGTQTTPAVDAGYVALAVVTVANGQATITAGNITAASGGQSLQAVLLSQFTGTNQNIATTGYQKLPGGLIVQWGVASPTDSNGNKSVTFPLAFPTNCFIADACVAAAQADNPCLMAVNSITKTGFVVNAKTYAGSWQPFVGAGGYWVAFGN